MTKAKVKASKPKTPAKEASGMDSRGHKIGSRKGKVHTCFVEQDEATAFTLGQRLKLKDGTLRSWFGMWNRAAKPAKTSKVAAKFKSREEKPETKEAVTTAA